MAATGRTFTAHSSGAHQPQHRLPWPALLCVLLAAAFGVLAAALPNPLFAVAALVGLGAAAIVLPHPRAGLYLFLLVIATFPFGVIPIQVGAQLTFVDASLLLTFGAVLLSLLGPRRQGRPFQLEAPTVLLTLFVLQAIVSFFQGSGYAPTTPELLHSFVKLVASLLFFLVVLNIVRQQGALTGLVRAFMLVGAVVGAVGAGLWLLSPATQQTLLLALHVIGYPTSDVLRYVPGPNNTYTTQLRATGTAVDPNVFGGTTMLALVLIVVQVVSPRPVWPRPWLLLLALPAAAGLVLSESRGAWVGAAVGILLVGTLRYRRLWIGALAGGAAFLVLPSTQQLVARFLGGFSTADPATALRVGEYANALTIIQRYPLLGIGFGQSPDADVTAGVSSIFLLVGEQMGLLGLAVYVLLLLVILAGGILAFRSAAMSADPARQSVLGGLLAAFTAALVAGSFDHYFANQAFPHAVALFWLTAALLVAAARREPTSRSAPAPAPASSRRSRRVP